MAKPGDLMVHRLTRHRIRWRDTAATSGGERLAFELFLPHDAPPLPRHRHPRQVEHAQVLAGSLRVRTHGRSRVLREGESVTFGANQVHSVANVGTGELHLLVELRPALDA